MRSAWISILVTTGNKFQERVHEMLCLEYYKWRRYIWKIFSTVKKRIFIEARHDRYAVLHIVSILVNTIIIESTV